MEKQVEPVVGYSPELMMEQVARLKSNIIALADGRLHLKEGTAGAVEAHALGIIAECLISILVEMQKAPGPKINLLEDDVQDLPPA